MKLNDFSIGVLAGGVAWLWVISSGVLPENVVMPLDAFLANFGEVIKVKLLLLYALIGGVIASVISPLVRR